ncbi:MAG: PspA/IM30 family protein, partial [Marinosulfonomonas sp.]|nr:PspA/IM30 family protein [Marinosulfonomonas sp.]
MFKTIKTLFAGANARAEERVRDTYSIELIEQKIREAQTGLKAAKATLASLIQRSRAEGRQIEVLETRAKDMTSRAKEALKGGREDMANEAAQAIAEMENELTLRRDTASRLETRIIRL